MATEVLMPRQGNTVESCVILEWKKSEGDTIQEGEIICEVETDKAAFEVEAPASGTVLRTFFEEGDDVPVLTVIAALGEPGEDVSGLAPDGSASPAADAAGEQVSKKEPAAAEKKAAPAAVQAPQKTEPAAGGAAISPRAKMLARSKGIDYTTVAGSGPGGRIIERDIHYVLSTREPFTPAAMEKQPAGTAAPLSGSGIGGRVTAADMAGGAAVSPAAAALDFPGPVDEQPVKGVRKLIAQRMTAALQSTAQLTLNSSADARVILAYRKKLKAAPEDSGLGSVSLNDIVLYAAAKNLLEYADLNAHFLGDTVKRFAHVHLGFAVDTPRGLMVPVLRNAHAMSLKQISMEAKRLASACIEGKINPDELSGATFTVTNLGAFGIESFTPIANAPEVGILGINTVQPKPVTDENGETRFVPHIGFSLTIDHQLIDGALGAKFLQGMARRIENFDVTLAG